MSPSTTKLSPSHGHQVWSLTASGDLASPQGSGRWSGMASKRWPKGQPVAIITIHEQGIPVLTNQYKDTT